MCFFCFWLNKTKSLKVDLLDVGKSFTFQNGADFLMYEPMILLASLVTILNGFT